MVKLGPLLGIFCALYSAFFGGSGRLFGIIVPVIGSWVLVIGSRHFCIYGSRHSWCVSGMSLEARTEASEASKRIRDGTEP
jgi:hypothetical protein